METTFGNNESLVKVKVTKDSAVDATVSRQLADSIKTVSRRVNTINSSFEEIKHTIRDPLLNLDVWENEGLVTEWDSLQKDFNSTLQASGKVANGASALIRDFLLVVMPYLLDNSHNTDFRIKQKKLGEYRAELDKGGDLAFDFVNNFKYISRRVQGFKRHWGDHTADTIDKLASEIGELEESMSQAKGLVDKKKRNRLKFLKKTSKAQANSELKVVKYTDSIPKGTKNLADVWNFVYDDLNTIVSQLKLIERSGSQDLFRKRLEALEVQYRDLRQSLQTYSAAIDHTNPSSSSKPSFFAKLFRLEM